MERLHVVHEISYTDDFVPLIFNFIGDNANRYMKISTISTHVFK